MIYSLLKPTALALALFSASLTLYADAITDLQAKYAIDSTQTFSTETGQKLWNKRYQNKDGKERSCASCHGDNLTLTGKHAKTGKLIKPMAPSVNPQRLSNTKKIEKWFKRNCKWTLGRECTAQEKGHMLSYLANL